jgi:hypothetical protein
MSSIINAGTALHNPFMADVDTVYTLAMFSKEPYLALIFSKLSSDISMMAVRRSEFVPIFFVTIFSAARAGVQ